MAQKQPTTSRNPDAKAEPREASAQPREARAQPRERSAQPREASVQPGEVDAESTFKREGPNPAGGDSGDTVDEMNEKAAESLVRNLRPDESTD
jgi:hypothetical protein